MTAAAEATVLIVAGETSGEEHAAGLVRSLLSLSEGQLSFFGSGGASMKEAGVELLGDVADLGAIGPVQAVSNLAAYRRLFNDLVAETAIRRPELAVLVDFPEFNLRLAARLKRLGVPVCYFISPQLWAWRRGRVKQIRRWVDLMLVILPFEEDFYGRHGVCAHYVGNPTRGRLAGASSLAGPPGHGPRQVALLPGSRRGEIEMNLPIHLDAAARIAGQLEARFEIARAPAVESEQIQTICRQWAIDRNQELDVVIAQEPSEVVLARAHAAVVKSGTSTLEAMVLGVPFAMTYRMSWVSWLLLRPLVRIQRLCLANLVAGNDLVPEFVQTNARGDRIGDWIVRILEDEDERQRIIEGLAEGRRRLGTKDAFAEAADQIQKRFFSRPVGS